MAKDLRQFLDVLERKYPHEMVRVARPIDPARFEVTALLQHLENDGKFPLVLFESPLDLHGRPSGFPLASNVFARRQRCAGIGLDSDCRGPRSIR